MSIVAKTYDLPVGMEARAATHTLALVEAATIAMLDIREFPTRPAGLLRAVD